MSAESRIRLGQRIRSLRERRGVQLEACAKRLGVSRYALSRVERGTSVVTPDLLVEIGRVLSMSVEELVTGQARTFAPRLRVRGASSSVRQASSSAYEPPQTNRTVTEVPLPVVHVLARGRLGEVSDRELRLLIKTSCDPDYDTCLPLLEMHVLWRRSLADISNPDSKVRYDEAFERFRTEMLEDT